MKAAFVMLDLETLSTAMESAPILSIGGYLLGVIETDFGSGVHSKGFWEQNCAPINNTFHTVVNYTDQLDNLDRFASKCTLDWWTSVGDNASELLKSSKNSKISLLSALQSLSAWLGEIKEQCHEVYIFGNGAAFDNAILEIAYREIGLDIPWKYRNSLCFRTMFAALYSIHNDKQSNKRLDSECKNMVKYITGENFVEHNALHDAIYQGDKLKSIVINQLWLNIVHNTTKK